MDGQGEITVEISDLQPYVYIDITDTGKGIPRGNQKLFLSLASQQNSVGGDWAFLFVKEL